MKKINVNLRPNRTIILSFLWLFIGTVVTYAQWNPTPSDPTTSIYRTGKVGIGMTNASYAQLQVEQEILNVLPGQEIGIIPTFRLQRNFNTTFDNNTYAWDFFANESLSIKTGDGNAFALAMRLNKNALQVAGDELVLGYGGTTTKDNLTMGFSDTYNGHFIGFNGTYHSAGTFQGLYGKAAIHSSDDGSLYFLTQPTGGFIAPAENRRFTLTPDGEAIVGDSENNQVLKVVSRSESILQLAHRMDGANYEILRNDDSELEFRGGTSGSGSALPRLMLLNSGGQLMIGTSNSPNTIDGGITDISDYHLYVAGGILSEEVRVRTGWADYVFEKDYDLLPLKQVKTHIETHGHLHNTPSAEQIENGGLELGSMTVNQQEKIEELFLHLIAMQEKMDALEAKNKALEQKLERLER